MFLHLGLSFPSGRLAPGLDRGLVIAGYLIFPLAFVPALLFAGPHELGCDDCPTNLLLIDRDETLAAIARAFGALLYASLFVVVLVRAVRRWRQRRVRAPPAHAGLRVRAGRVPARHRGPGSGTGIAARWAALSAALLPFTFLGSLLRTHVSHLDAELRESLEELRASRARIVDAGDAERRRLERDLHDGAQSRLVALALLCAQRAHARADDGELAAMLDRAQEELQTSLGELRELARGIHPAVLTDRGLEPALDALVTRAPVPVTLEADGGERLPGAGRERRLLRRLRGARERREVRPGDAGERGGPARERPRDRRGRRTTASAAPTRPAAPACAGSPTASRRSTARSSSTARRPRDAPARGHPARR